MTLIVVASIKVRAYTHARPHSLTHTSIHYGHHKVLVLNDTMINTVLKFVLYFQNKT